MSDDKRVIGIDEIRLEEHLEGDLHKVKSRSTVLVEICRMVYLKYRIHRNQCLLITIIKRRGGCR